MPYFCAVGSTAASIARLKIEYGGCSARNRARPRFSATHWASTICSAGKSDDPIARTFPARTKSVSTESVSSMSVAGSGRCTW